MSPGAARAAVIALALLAGAAAAPAGAGAAAVQGGLAVMTGGISARSRSTSSNRSSVAPIFTMSPLARTRFLTDTPLTLLPALELAFAPQEGPPGTVVNFTVRNLVAGELRLDYAGRVVFGPAAVAAGDADCGLGIQAAAPAKPAADKK